MEALNILPINDIQQHKEDEHCMCNPATRVHCGVKIVIHNAFDGRDIDEFMEDALEAWAKGYLEEKPSRDTLRVTEAYYEFTKSSS